MLIELNATNGKGHDVDDLWATPTIERLHFLRALVKCVILDEYEAGHIGISSAQYMIDALGVGDA